MPDLLLYETNCVIFYTHLPILCTFYPTYIFLLFLNEIIYNTYYQLIICINNAEGKGGGIWYFNCSSFLHTKHLYFHLKEKAMSRNPDYKLLPTAMNTLSEVMDLLAEKGYDNEIVFSDEGYMEGMGKAYRPEDLRLIRTYRFEGLSDPADNTALYLLADEDHNVGYIVDIYGYDSNYGVAFSEFLKKIPVQEETV